MKYTSKEAGFSVEVDGEWIVKEKKKLSGDIVCSFELPGKPVSFNIICGPTHPDNVTTMKYRKKWAKNYLKRHGYKKIEVKELYLPNLLMSALDVKYVVRHRELYLTVRKVEVIYGPIIYIFTFSAIPSVFINFEPFFDQVIHSFKVT